MAPDNFALPALPATDRNIHRQSGIPQDQLTRKKLQVLLHLITADLKARGTRTPHVFLPFRSRVDDGHLEHFLRSVFPGGVMIDTLKTSLVKLLLKSFDEFTLICALKYLWCRLPHNEIIGWNVYLEFKRRERDAGYPKDAFLTIMPKCLSSSSHASIVYDFLDLMISVATNSQYNHLSGRKIAKMASVWAFNSTPHSSLAFYDATSAVENSFLDGLEAWELTCNGLFHLLLAFLRAMLPDTEAETLNLPKTLQTLLVTNTYPPPDKAPSMKSVITIPCVQIRSTKRCADPYELISKVRHNLRFDKKDDFLSIENYTILKNIFQKDSTNEIVSTLTEESRRVLTRLSANPIDSEYNLYPGWSRESAPEDPNIPMYTEVTISNVSLQDYYIWTWLSSLGSDQSSALKSLFGRSIVVEAGLRGFQKWLILSETTMSSDDYLNNFKNYAGSPQRAGRSPIPQAKSLPLPPNSAEQAGYAPIPVPKDTLLPDVSFKDDQFNVDGISDSNPASYQRFMTGLGDDDSRFAGDFEQKLNIQKPKQSLRPRPPPLQNQESSLRPEALPQSRKTPERYVEEEQHDYPEYQTYQAFTDQTAYQNESGHIAADNGVYENYKSPFEEPQVNGGYSNGIEAKHKGGHEPHENFQAQPTQGYKLRMQQGVEDPYKTRTNAYQKHTDQDGLNAPDGHQPEPQAGYMSYGAADYQVPHTPEIDHQSQRRFQNQKSQELPPEPQAQNGISLHDDHNTAFKGFEDSPPKLADQDKHHHYNEQPYQNEASYQNNEPYQGEGSYQDDGFYQHVDYQGGNSGDMNAYSLYPNEDFPSGSYPDSRHDELPPLPSGVIESDEKKKKKKKKRKPKATDDYFPMENLPDGPPPPLPPLTDISNSSPQMSKYEVKSQNGDPYGQVDQVPQEYQNGNVNGFASQGYQQNENSTYMPTNQEYPPQPTQPDQIVRNEDARIPKTKERRHKKHHDKQARGNYDQPSEPYLHPNQGGSQDANLLMRPSSYQTSMDNVSPAASQFYTPEGQPQALSDNSPTPARGRIQLPPTQHLHPQSSPLFLDPRQGQFSTSQQRVASTLPRRQQPLSPQMMAPPQQAYQQPAHRAPQAVHPQQPMAQPMAPPMQAAPQQMRPAPQQMQQPIANYAQPMQSGHHGHPAPQQAAPIAQPMAGAPMAGAPMAGAPMPQYYYPPPPQGYYQPPQGYGYPQQPMYYPPPQGYFPPPQKQKAKPTASEMTMMWMPPSARFNKNAKSNKANMRAALQGKDFGI